MEKLIYVLWRDETSDPRIAFNERLLGPVAQAILPHVRGLRINVQDATVAEGTSPHFIVTRPPVEAFVQLWVDSAWSPHLAPIETALAGACKRFAGFLVSEAAAIPNRTHVAALGQRTEGFSQMVCLTVPAGTTHAAWRDAWQNGHTVTGIETQSNFEYLQNLVVRPLGGDAPPYAAIVEECFPIAARHDEAVFYDAVGDPAKLAANQDRMMASCARFIGAEGCDCVPTSQFDLARPF